MRIGLLGMRRRIADYDPALGFELSQLVITIAGFMVASSVVIFFINMYPQRRKRARLRPAMCGNRARPNGRYLRLRPQHNYAQPVVVVGEPYDYGADDEYVFVDLSPSAAHPQPIRGLKERKSWKKKE